VLDREEQSEYMVWIRATDCLPVGVPQSCTRFDSFRHKVVVIDVLGENFKFFNFF
jgi:hypothetical protein